MKIKSKLIFNRLIFSLAAVALVVTISLAASGSARASGDASFSLSSSTTSYTAGQTITLQVNETSISADDVDAVQADLSYPASLQYVSMSLNGPFTICAQDTAGGGSISIGCASSSAVSGSQQIAAITFTANTTGSAQVSMVTGSNIDNTSGASVWNGTLPNITYTISAASTGSGGGSGGGGSSGSGGGGTSTTTTGTGSSTKKSTSSSTPTPTPTPAPTPTPTPTPVPSPPPTVKIIYGSLSIRVTDDKNQPVANAKVTLNKTKVAYTNKNGVANFSGVKTGSNSIVIQASSKKTVTESVSVTAGQNKLVDYKLASSNNYLPLAVTVILAIIIVVGLRYLLFRKRNKPNPPIPSNHGYGIVVSSFDNSASHSQTAYVPPTNIGPGQITPNQTTEPPPRSSSGPWHLP